MPKTDKALLEKAQKKFQDILFGLYENIGLQELPEKNTAVLVEDKTAFDLHAGQKYFGICRPVDFKPLQPKIEMLKSLRDAILELKRSFGYAGKLERSFLVPQVKSVTSGSVTLSINQTQKIIPIKAGLVREMVSRHPKEPFFKNLLKSGDYQHLGTKYLTSNFRFAPLGQPQTHVKGGVLLIHESGKPIHMNFRFSGILAGVSRADKIQDRPSLKMTVDGRDYEFFAKSGKAEDLKVFGRIHGQN